MELINSKISASDISVLSFINELVISQGLKQMKTGKNDSIHTFQSDCLLNGPANLITHLTNIVKMIISHGQVPANILVCTLLLLVEDNLGDLTSSDNYRAIATGSQLLKLLDIVILIIERDKLKCDQLSQNQKSELKEL